MQRLHQEGLRAAQRDAERDRQTIRENEIQADRDSPLRSIVGFSTPSRRDRQAFQEEIRRIWEYLA
ncbi:MAG: hypothetical protein ACYTXT_29015 [Nostoc sp.]